MLHKFALGCIALIAATSAAEARQVSDPSARFSMTVPDDWTQVQIPDPIVAYAAWKNSQSPMNGFCVAVIVDVPETRSKSQSEIDEMLTNELTEAVWRAAYESKGLGVVVHESGRRDANGRKVHFAFTTATVPQQGGAGIKVKGREELHALPGSSHSVTCMALEANYDAVAEELKGVLHSYVPNAGLVAQLPGAAKAGVSMYA